jgi:hypothetical protein
MNRSRDRRAEEVRWCSELAEQLAAAHYEASSARAKVLADAEAFERLRGERDQLVGTMDELHGKLDASDRERIATVRLS